MKKTNNFFSDDFEDFKPKKVKISKPTKSKQVSFYELDYDDDYQQNKRNKNEYPKRY